MVRCLKPLKCPLPCPLMSWSPKHRTPTRCPATTVVNSTRHKVAQHLAKSATGVSDETSCPNSVASHHNRARLQLLTHMARAPTRNSPSPNSNNPTCTRPILLATVNTTTTVLLDMPHHARQVIVPLVALTSHLSTSLSQHIPALRPILTTTAMNRHTHGCSTRRSTRTRPPHKALRTASLSSRKETKASETSTSTMTI